MKKLFLEAGYIIEDDWDDQAIPSRRAYFDPDNQLRKLDYKSQLEWVAEHIAEGLEESYELAERWPSENDLNDWLDTKCDFLDEGIGSMSPYDMAAYSAYGAGLEIYNTLGEKLSTQLGLLLVDGDAPGRDFQGVKFRGDVDHLNNVLADQGLQFHLAASDTTDSTEIDAALASEETWQPVTKTRPPAPPQAYEKHDFRDTYKEEVFGPNSLEEILKSLSSWGMREGNAVTGPYIIAIVRGLAKRYREATGKGLPKAEWSLSELRSWLSSKTIGKDPGDRGFDGNARTAGSTSKLSKPRSRRSPAYTEEEFQIEMEKRMRDGIVRQVFQSDQSDKSLISRSGNPPADTETTNLTPSTKEQQSHPSQETRKIDTPQEIKMQISDQIAELVFPEDARFLNVEGIPVVASKSFEIGAVRYDRNPPEPYSSARAFKNGAEVSREEFEKLISSPS